MLHLYRSSEELGKQMSLFHFLFYIVLCPFTFPAMEVLFLLYFLVPFFLNLMYCMVVFYMSTGFTNTQGAELLKLKNKTIFCIFFFLWCL